MESVYLNDQIITEKRNLFSLTSTHDIAFNNQQYQIVLKVLDAFKGVLQVQLLKDGVLLDTQVDGMTYNENSEHNSPREQIKSFLLSFAIYGIIGGVIGLLVGIGMSV